MEFHISRNARERYQFAESLFSFSGNVVFANISACREFAYRMNKVRDAEKHPEQAIHAGQLYAMGLIDEASHVLMARYREQFDPAVMTRALEWFSGQVGAEALGKLLLTFVEEFPGTAVMRGEMTPRQWLAGKTEGTSHWAVALEELLLLWTANRNEAFQAFGELFEEKTLAERTVYRKVTEQLPNYFATRPLIALSGVKPMTLLELLRAPAVGSPRSLSEQIALIRKLWKPLIGESLELYLLVAGEILHEEELAIWMQFNPPAAQAKAAAEAAAKRRAESGTQQWPSIVSTAEVPTFGDPAHEYEKFSPDTAWMPTTVLVAKSTYVWLAQMSKQYGRAIRRLDEIPDEELATLARRGLNSLWLIGVWERSRASKTIKQLCGNTDAVASAYSLFDYQISEDLGGEAAYTNLRDRAYHHGIRLASDMVPNHMGIDSPWVVEHPEWFMSRPESPYPAYSFNGPDLSYDGRVEIKIEDHYFEQTDAAVVFRRRDRASGETRFIYHGNDGTSFPWNDTAQLDYLNSAVREQVIQTILHVARLFPVIRFDAAMTLAKRHFHRLWFPGPGSSGAIPSRAEYSMSQAEFDRAMPHEFWREVVDRVAAEVPGTLLLAEAFWLMEGYFVRTLGMHRVYNSAFMVMLRDEDNAKYRSVIKNTLEFDPDIMKRYVNFMSNPDERTAIDQFGKGDKCFGVAAMMATLPGLPMFGHGQIEGFTEKYGMEYQRPRYDESPDHWMVERHEREIAPLLKRRRLFAESGNFLLYDFFTDAGKVDENVFAYSNRRGDERALVVYNNHYGQTHGTIDYSAAYADKGAGQLRQQRIREGLGLSQDSAVILAWRDSFTGLEFLRRASDLAERGITLDLHAYQCHVFLDWRELRSTAGQPWDRLCDQLNGSGVASLEDALINLELQPVHEALRAQLDSGIVRLFADLAEHPRTLAVGVNTEIEAERTKFFEEAWTGCESFLRVAQRAYQSRSGGGAQPANPGLQPANPGLLGAAFRDRLRAAMRLPAIEALFQAPWTVAARGVLPNPSPRLTATAIWGPVLGWCALELLAESIDSENPEPVALDLFDRLRLREPFAQAFAALGFEGDEGWRVAARIKVVLLAGSGVGKPLEEPLNAEAALQSTALNPSIKAEAALHGTGTNPSIKGIERVEATQAAEKTNPEGGGGFIPRITPVEYAPALAAEGLPVSPEIPSLPADRLAPAETIPEPSQALPPALWSDPDLRWLCGVHQADGHEYLVRESYEELLWWLQMPSLLRLAAQTAPSRSAVQRIGKTVEEALAAAEAAGYRVDLLLAPPAVEVENDQPATAPASGVQAAPESAAEVHAQALPLPESEPKEPNQSDVLYQGTTSVVPQMPLDEGRTLQAAEKLNSEGGWGSNSRIRPTESAPALAADGHFLPVSFEPPSFSAASLAPEGCSSEISLQASSFSADCNAEPLPAESVEAPAPDIETTPEPAIQAESSAEAEASTQEEQDPIEPEAEETVQPVAEPESEETAVPIVEPTPEPTAKTGLFLCASNRSHTSGVKESEEELENSQVLYQGATSAEQQMPQNNDQALAPEVKEIVEAYAQPETTPETALETVPEEVPDAEDLPEQKQPPLATEIEEPVQAGVEADAEPEPSVETAADTQQVEPAIEPIVEPAPALEAKPSITESWEPLDSGIGFTVTPIAEPQTAIEALPSLSEPWEPSAPKIEFVARPVSQAEPPAASTRQPDKATNDQADPA